MLSAVGFSISMVDEKVPPNWRETLRKPRTQFLSNLVFTYLSAWKLVLFTANALWPGKNEVFRKYGPL